MYSQPCDALAMSPHIVNVSCSHLVPNVLNYAVKIPSFCCFSRCDSNFIVVVAVCVVVVIPSRQSFAVNRCSKIRDGYSN